MDFIDNEPSLEVFRDPEPRTHTAGREVVQPLGGSAGFPFWAADPAGLVAVTGEGPALCFLGVGCG